MSSDPLQEAWQTQPLPGVDIDQLVREFRRGQQEFAATIFWRDVREVVVSLLLLPLWVGMGVGFGLPWTWYLVMPVFVWIAGFMMADRRRQRRQRSLAGDSLIRSVESSLAEAEHQIWLLRNVHWWYLLPLAVPILAFLAQTFWERLPRENVWETAIGACFITVVIGGVFILVYWINQKAVSSTLEPRRQELSSLLRSLSEEPRLHRDS